MKHFGELGANSSSSGGLQEGSKVLHHGVTVDQGSTDALGRAFGLVDSRNRGGDADRDIDHDLATDLGRDWVRCELNKGTQ